MLLCIHVPSFALEVARRHTARDAEAAFILADKADRGRVLEVDERAYALGARPGQTVLQACVAASGARVLLHDAGGSRAVWSDMLDALDALSPLIDDAAEGTAFVEMRGSDGMAGDWIRRARELLKPFELPVRVALGPNKFTARAATYVRDGCICAPDEAATVLAPLPLTVLALETTTIERLHLLGVHTLGELAALPHGPFVRRFGTQAARWHEHARGIDPQPFRPRPYEVQIEAAAFGEGSAAQEEQVYFALRVLAEQLCGDLSRAGKAVTLLRTIFECENGDRTELEAGFAQPAGQSKVILDILRAKIEGLTFDSPITGLRLQAIRLEECGTPATLFAGNQPDPQALAVALERLQAISDAKTHQARVCPSHLLESRFTYGQPAMALPNRPEQDASAGNERPSLQLRMLAMRKVAVKMRGNLPVSVDARAVRDCAGPWRVDDAWFDARVARDEYDVLLEDGMLCRIYRQGEYWYLRGAYD